GPGSVPAGHRIVEGPLLWDATGNAEHALPLARVGDDDRGRSRHDQIADLQAAVDDDAVERTPELGIGERDPRLPHPRFGRGPLADGGGVARSGRLVIRLGDDALLDEVVSSVEIVLRRVA